MKLSTPYSESDVYRTSSCHIQIVCDEHPYRLCGDALRTGLHEAAGADRPVYSVKLHGEALPDLHVLLDGTLHPLQSRNGKRGIDAEAS